MRYIAEIRAELEEFAAGGDSAPFPAAAIEEISRLPERDLQRTDEHDMALLVCLAAICCALAGRDIPEQALRMSADRYGEISILYTGRVMPRIKETLGQLATAVAEASLPGLVRVADLISQGWPDYRTSVFPGAFAALADTLGVGTGGRDAFLDTSFHLWRQGLAAAAADNPQEAARLFERSLRRYRRYHQYADAAWLYTDLVVSLLASGDTEAAERVLDEQRGYVRAVIADAGLRPAAAATPAAFHLGDVRSGTYSSFVDSPSVDPQWLGPDDQALLHRYVRVSESMLAYASFHFKRDLHVALDLFSFGWQGYISSPYPAIFRHLVRRVSGSSQGAPVLLTAHVRWQGLLLAGQLRLKPADLVRTTTDLYERLRAAGLDREADIALLDGGMLHLALYGKAATAAWLSRRLTDLRAQVPVPLQAVVEALQTPPLGGLQPALARYLGARSSYQVPDFMPALPVFHRDHLGRREPAPELHLAIHGESLWINGIMVYENTPPALARILQELGKEHLAAGAADRDTPFLSAAELAERTGRTPSAVVQTVRRFRIACKESFDRLTERGLEPDSVLQGRPGYRLNPAHLSEVAFHLLP
jgi:hypothetical protein